MLLHFVWKMYGFVRQHYVDPLTTTTLVFECF